MASTSPAPEIETNTPSIEYNQCKGVPSSVVQCKEVDPKTIEINWEKIKFRHSNSVRNEKSQCFVVDGSDWQVICYRNGYRQPRDRGFLSVHFKPVNYSQDVEIKSYKMKIHAGGSICAEKIVNSALVFRTDIDSQYGINQLANARQLPNRFHLCLTIELKKTKEMHLPLPNIYTVEVPALIKMFDDQANTDVTLKCIYGNENYQICAHCSLLSAFSPVFSAMLNGEWSEKHTKTINIQEDISEQAMAVFVRMFYGATVEGETFAAVAPQLFVLSSLYNVELLQNICIEWIVKTLSIESAVETLLVADRFEGECPVLKPAVLEFIAVNAKDIMGHESYKLLLEHKQTRLLSQLNIALADKINTLTSHATKRKRSE